MLVKEAKIHLEIQTSRKTPVGILRTTFWDKEQKNTGISKLPESKIKHLTNCA